MIDRKAGIAYIIYKELFEYYCSKESLTIYDRLDIERLTRSHNVFRYFDSDNRMRGNMRLLS